jgi:hypothetical protein
MRDEVAPRGRQERRVGATDRLDRGHMAPLVD